MTDQELKQITAYKAKADEIKANIAKYKKFVIDIGDIAKDGHCPSISTSRVERSFPNDVFYRRSVEFISILAHEEINKLEKEFESLKLSDFKEV